MSLRGPKPLRFRALLDCISEHGARMTDTRQANKVHYRLDDCLRSGFAMFYLQDPSLLAFQRRFQEEVQRNNLSSVFGVAEIPSDSQLREILDRPDSEPLAGVYLEVFQRMQRAKLLDRYRFLGGAYLMSMDGSGYFSSEQIHCPQCLRMQSRKGGPVRYHHQILQATVVHPDLPQVIPLAPEFIQNTDCRATQDGEVAAGYRLVERIRATHPRLPIILVADSLHAKQPLIERLAALEMRYILTAKPADHKSLFEDIEGLRGGRLLDRQEIRDKKGKLHRYEWVNGVPLNATPRCPTVNFLEYWILAADGKVGYHCSWVTDLELTEATVAEVVRGGRSRWKIENEGFNTLKNHGYHLEHNYGHGSEHLCQLFFLLNLLAFFFHQIFEQTDQWYQRARSCFTSRAEYWNALRAAFRLLLFDLWDQVLERFLLPPQPAFG